MNEPVFILKGNILSAMIVENGFTYILGLKSDGYGH